MAVDELANEIAEALSVYKGTHFSRCADITKIAERLIDALNANSSSTFECVEMHGEDDGTLNVVIKETPPQIFRFTITV